MEAVPQDLLEGILVRLPVKSLCRFKCVCRSWRDLISKQYFIKAQISHAKPTSCGKDPTLLLCFHDDESPKISVCDKRRIDDEQYSLLSLRLMDLPPEFNSFGLSTSCDGMFCVSVSTDKSMACGRHYIAQRSVFLWNPFIHDLKRLPLPFAMEHAVCDCGTDTGFHDDWGCGQCRFGYDEFGIGYNPSIDDYYICKIPTDRSLPDSPVELLYLKSSSSTGWKPIANLWPCYRVSSWEAPTYFKGSLYSVAWRADADADADAGDQMILRYNGVDENFEEISVPENCLDFHLDIIQGRDLCLIGMTSYTGELRIWLYKEEDSSWSFFQRVPEALYWWLDDGEIDREIMQSTMRITSSCIYVLRERGNEDSSGLDEIGLFKYDFEQKTRSYYHKWSDWDIRFWWKRELIETLVSPTSLLTYQTSQV